jgi:hypothetical protein
MKTTIRAITALAAPALLAGCISFDSSYIPRDMRVATGDAVRDCRFLSDVHGSSVLYGPLADTAVATARKQAFRRARALGANTVVWGTFSTLYGPTSVTANAYVCPQTQQTNQPTSQPAI